MFGKHFSIKQCQKIQNIVKAAGDDGFDNDTIDYIIAQSIPVLYGEDYKLNFKNEEEKIVFKTKVMSDIGKVLKEYKKHREKKANNDKIFITYENKTYSSNFVNIKTYFEINKRISTEDIKSLVEDVLFMLYSDILPIEVFDEIKAEDPLYYEIILEDVSVLILKTLKDISTIKNIEKPEYLKKNNSSNLIQTKETQEESIYAIMLESYNISPVDVNKNKAYDILKAISVISNRHIISEFEEYIKDVKDVVFKKALIAQFEQNIGGGDK